LSTLAEDMEECFDDRGCTGLTIWLNSDRHIQVNTRGRDGVSWSCHTSADFFDALEEAVREFIRTNKPDKRRVPVDTRKRRRDAEDLI